MPEAEFHAGINRFLLDYVDKSRGKLILAYPMELTSLVASIEMSARNFGVSTIRRKIEDGPGSILSNLDGIGTVAILQSTKSYFSQQVIDFLQTNENVVFIRLFDASPELFSRCFRVPKADLSALNQKLIDIGSEARCATIQSRAGTNLTARFDNDLYHWVNSDGTFNGRHPAVLPASEVATYSSKISGIYVADGAINTNFGFPLDVRLSEAPITVDIQDSIVKSYSCSSPLLRSVLDQFFADDNGRRVGELGFGTNTGIAEFVPFVSHINERFPSVHLGFGSANQPKEILNWSHPLHLDLISKQCDVWFDATPIQLNGMFCASMDSDFPKQSSKRRKNVVRADTI